MEFNYYIKCTVSSLLGTNKSQKKILYGVIYHTPKLLCLERGLELDRSRWLLHATFTHPHFPVNPWTGRLKWRSKLGSFSSLDQKLVISWGSRHGPSSSASIVCKAVFGIRRGLNIAQDVSQVNSSALNSDLLIVILPNMHQSRYLFLALANSVDHRCLMFGDT